MVPKRMKISSFLRILSEHKFKKYLNQIQTIKNVPRQKPGNEVIKKKY